MMKGIACERTLIMTAMAELIYQDRNYIEQGVPPERLLNAVFASKENAGLTKRYYEGILQRDFDNGGIVLMKNGNYSLGHRNMTEIDMGLCDANLYSYNGKMGSSNNSSAESSPLRMKSTSDKKKNSVIKKTIMHDPVKNDVRGEISIRVGERRKRPKTVFDPSENNLPSKRKRGRPMGSLNKTTIKKQINNVTKGTNNKNMTDSIESSNEDEVSENQKEIPLEVSNKITGGVCSVCRQSAKDETDKLIGCRDCSNKAHPDCLQGDGMLRLRPDNTWQCPHCKTCVICIETTDAGILTICNVCADAYHALCHTPPITTSMRAWNQWKCGHCSEGKNCSPNIENAYDKPTGSGRSSKHSDKSDIANSTLDRRKDKHSVKIEYNEEEKPNEIKLKSEPSFSPIYKDNSKSQLNRRTSSPVMQSMCKYNQEDDDLDIDDEQCTNEKSYTDFQMDIDSELNIDEEPDSNPELDINLEPDDNLEPDINQESDVNHQSDISPEPDIMQSSDNSLDKKLDLMDHSMKNNHTSIFMNNHDLNKMFNDSIYLKRQNYSNTGNDIDLSIPDAATWTYNDVYQYFLSFFPEQAHIFKEQQIDGQSLLVMRRSDVVHSLGLPLGPALKMYRHVVKLQTRKDDITMCWL